MALFNYATKEITLKIVYYGPGLSGKTTNLQFLHSALNPDTRGKLLSLATEADRTLFFDFLPVELGKIRDFSIRFQLYTVPGQVRYNATRKVVLKGADGVVFVADSQREMAEQNIESFANMRENLISNNLDPEEIPVVMQYNKRDLAKISSVEELDRDLNSKGYPILEASAIAGKGVEETFNLITRLVLKGIAKKHNVEVRENPQTTVEKEASSEPQPYASATAPQEENPPCIQPPSVPVPPDISRTADRSAPEVRVDAIPGGLKTEKTPPEDKGGSAAVSAETIPPRPAPLPPPAERPLSADKIDLLVKEMNTMRRAVAELTQSLTEIKSQLRAVEELGREREQDRALLREILAAVEKSGKEKRKFRFW